MKAMTMKAKESPEKQSEQVERTKEEEARFLILHNDDHHSFDYVINALISVCGHDAEQATQCTLITHYKGKCDVKKGSFTYLSPMKKALVARELTATID
ncbi:ATP-dependent Clp protease adaptor protein ClpS [Sunxiuqinia elliptica]|uniref:ATP-dependent Clp protease adaptor protein ClpS n=2 Tax=Sunxiuqinia elliptica TaxID=655355 RepID=A0A4R6GKQ7_9BACT|nr:ATP-dependent Clp protease adaptor protein ClpS [Sunxiuqinia elliptica]TDO66896.1 ATP-dependent Clp protease adaptor protein ClpS [Sunxiuqinia elliptica]